MLRVLVGAGNAPEETIAAAAALMPNACIISAYGMTEASSSITFDTLVSPASNTLHVEHRKPVPTPKWAEKTQMGAKESHCVGFPAPGFQLAIELLGEDAGEGDGLSDGSCAVGPWFAASSVGHR